MKKANIYMTSALILSLLAALPGCGKSQQPVKDSLIKRDENSIQQSIADLKLPEKLKSPDLRIMSNKVMKEDIEVAISEFEKKYGGKVTFEQLPYEEKGPKLILQVAAGDPPDIISWGDGDMPRYAINNLIQPVNQYVDPNNSLWNMRAMDEFKYKGNYYGFNREVIPGLIYYNSEMFSNNGLKTPLEYYKEDNWNWDTLKKLGMALTQDLDRDGTIDQWGYDGLRPDLFVYANGGDYVKYNNDGGIELVLKEDKVMEAFQFVTDGYNKDKYFCILTGANKMQLFKDRKFAMYGERVKANIKEDWNFEWDIVPFPNGPQGKKDVTPGGSEYWGITTGAKNPEGAVAWISLNAKLYKDSVENNLSMDFTPEQAALIQRLSKNVVLNHYVGIEEGTEKFSTQINSNLRKGGSISNAIDSGLPQYQAEIDQFLKGQ